MTNSYKIRHGSPRGEVFVMGQACLLSQWAGLQRAPIVGVSLIVLVLSDVEQPNSAW